MLLTQTQIDERAAVLKRFRELLEAQRNKFREYLTVLEKQSGTIESENPETILAHTELEQHIVENIVTLQKVIKPIETMYHELNASPFPLTLNTQARVSGIPELQADLARLQKQVLERNEQNRNLLKTHLTQIRKKMNEMQNPYRNLKSVYATAPLEQVASLIQVDA